MTDFAREFERRMYGEASEYEAAKDILYPAMCGEGEGKMTKDELLEFCGNKYPEPFNWNEHTYATNGHVLIKVPLLPDFEYGKGLNLSGFEGKAPVPLKYISMKTMEGLEPELVECPSCCGTKLEHPDCPRCECACDYCGGSGKENFYPRHPMGYEIEGTYFNCDYLRLLKDLPDCEIGVNKINIPTESFPSSRFRFSGGEGFIMPLKR